MNSAYVLDDTFEIPEEIEKMSDEERYRQMKIWEEEGRQEREKITHRKTLLVV